MQFGGASTTRDIFQYFTLGRIASVFIILIVTAVVIRYASRLLDLLSRRGPRIRFLAKGAEPIIRITLWFAAMLISFRLLAPTRGTFLALIGSAAIAIGLGAQDLIKNLIGGLVVLGDRPYQLGDLVQIGDAYGEIVHIGLRSTKLYTFGDTMVTIPNADILGGKVFDSNSGVPQCQVETCLYLPPDADPDEAIRVGFDAAYTCPYLYSAKPVFVLIEDKFEQRPYARLHIKAYVCDHRLLPRMQSDITTRAKREFLRRGMLTNWSPSTLSPEPR
ncbi:MAG: mechanosensitive ion channel family protein [Candidatus Acidiferrales bacterium]